LNPSTTRLARRSRKCNEGRSQAHPAYRESHIDKKEGALMSASDKIENAAEKLAGKAKEAVGNATDNHETAQEGRNDQSKASAKQAGENIKDVFK
jgi:uncharacterized protein YjbJ (UPF0337 family)